MDEPSPDLRAVIRAFRARVGITQAALASKLGVSERYVRATERGRLPGPQTLRRLAGVMRQVGECDLARSVSQMALSERDFRSIERKLLEATRRIGSLEERVRNLEARRDCSAPLPVAVTKPELNVPVGFRLRA